MQVKRVENGIRYMLKIILLVNGICQNIRVSTAILNMKAEKNPALHFVVIVVKVHGEGIRVLMMKEDVVKDATKYS